MKYFDKSTINLSNNEKWEFLKNGKDGGPTLV